MVSFIVEVGKRGRFRNVKSKSFSKLSNAVKFSKKEFKKGNVVSLDKDLVDSIRNIAVIGEKGKRNFSKVKGLKGLRR